MRNPPQTMSRDELVTEVERLREKVDRLEQETRDGHRERKDLADSEERYRILVELAADAILMGDTQGNIIGTNHSALVLTGYSRDELIGMNIARLFSDGERQRHPLRYDLLKEGKVILNERTLTRKDGSTVAIAMNSKMMPDGTYHTAMRNVSERKRLEEQMHAANRELEAFVYTVSHDLRTPLTLIIGYSDYLKEQLKSRQDDHILDILSEIENAGSRMLSFMEDLLSLAIAGHLQRPSYPVSASKIAESVVIELQSQLVDAGLSVHLQNLPELHVPESFLSQIFENLIGNAIRHAYQKQGIIEVGAERSGSQVRFFVRDQGKGIHEEDRSRIFEVFFRGQRAQGTKGTGVGLAIVQKLARTLGGKAWLEETPGGGCTFWVEMQDIAPTGEDAPQKDIEGA